MSKRLQKGIAFPENPRVADIVITMIGILPDEMTLAQLLPLISQRCESQEN
jgi:hypothetical protein